MEKENKKTNAPKLILKEYCNPRFNFCLKYPIDKLPIKMLSDNGDGIILNTKDQTATLRVSGSYNMQGRSTTQFYEAFITSIINSSAKDRIDYVIITEDYYEVSFIHNEQYRYQKLYHLGSKFILLEAVGPKEKIQQLKNLKDSIQLDV